MRKPYVGTKVGWGRTQAQITKLFAKYGIKDVQFTHYGGEAIVGFLLPETQWAVQLAITIDLEDLKETNRRWRVLHWYIKARLEGAASELSDMRREWLSHILIGGQTIADRMLPEMEQLGLSGQSFAGLLPPGNPEAIEGALP